MTTDPRRPTDDDDMTPNDGAWIHDPAVHRRVAEVRAERDRDRAEQVRCAESPLARLRRVFEVRP